MTSQPNWESPLFPKRYRGRVGVFALTVIHFFAGGAVLFVAALALIFGSAMSYDGILSLIGWPILALIVAVVSIIAAMVLGLPVRLIPSLRSWWRSHGTVTLIGAVLGFMTCVVVLATAPIVLTHDESGDYLARNPDEWALLAAWSIFSISVAHFVWPTRGARIA